MNEERYDEQYILEPGVAATLVEDISRFLGAARAEQEMQTMDRAVADHITPEDYFSYARYKEFCVQQLAQYNQTPNANGSLCAAIERGFVLGYWFALKETAKN